jgi:selenocysteine lyase/cysteine desulfurase
MLNCTMQKSRRALLAAPFLQNLAPAQDRDWQTLAADFPVDRAILNFNHAGVGTTPRTVLDSVLNHTRIGEQSAPNTIFSYAPRLEPIRQGLATLLGSHAEEVAITRNATESLNAILLGLPLKAGDEVLTTTLDYWAMLDALDQRRERDGVVVKKLKIPVPCHNLDEIVKLFDAAITARTKVILISHPVNLHGQLFPVRDICRLAHSKGIEVVVDAAQSFALKDYKIADLGCDYLGASLHKWLQAPKGTGLLYVRRDKIEKLWPLFAAGTTRSKSDIRKFELFGTWPQTILAIEEALQFHNRIGSQAKQDRHVQLTNYWLDKVKDIKALQLHTPIGEGFSCGITCVEIAGIPAPQLRDWLLKKHSILTMDITRRTKEFAGIRISPGLSTTKSELDHLVSALHEAASGKLPA